MWANQRARPASAASVDSRSLRSSGEQAPVDSGYQRASSMADADTFQPSLTSARASADDSSRRSTEARVSPVELAQ